MMRKMNATVCQEMRDSVYWGGAGNVTTFTILAFIDMIVIFGNILIIAAVYHSIKLRNVTNLFIVSLACADLMVGVAVLPFSATMEVLKVWIFGDIWCSMWLAVDVWMCTASILNLCAISLDRYLAVTRPIKYPTIMSPKRAKLLVAIVWVLSFIICFPPLVNQKEKELQGNNMTASPNQTESNSTVWVNSTQIILIDDYILCPWTCELTSDTSYVIYSALGSFYIPTLVMLFFYWRIYLAAASTTKAINRGFRTTKSTKSSGSQPDEQRLTLRIHRGRGASEHNGSNGSPRGSDSRSPSKRDRIKISVSYPSTETLNTKCNNSLERTPSRCSQVSVHYANGQAQSQLCPSSKSTHLKVGAGGIGRAGSARRASRRSSCESQAAGDAVSLRELAPGSNEEKPRVMKMGKRNIKAQVKRIRMETKAAKTLGIIVGGFIMCWLPFFTVYVVQGFCGDCVNKVVFSVLFWLGYCNSAINPCIYALFSKEFRFAFKKIICNCFFKQRANTLRRGSDGSQLTTRNDGRLPGSRGARRGPSPGFSLEDSDGLGSEAGLVHSQSDSR